MTTDREALANLVAACDGFWSDDGNKLQYIKALAAARARLALPETTFAELLNPSDAMIQDILGEVYKDAVARGDWNGGMAGAGWDLIAARAVLAAMAPKRGLALPEAVQLSQELIDELWTKACMSENPTVETFARFIWEAALAAPQINAPAPEAERARWIAICKDHAADTTPSRKPFDNYLDGWLDACNEIMWAGEADPINAPAGTPAIPMESDSNALGHETERFGKKLRETE